jgi:hypothetical protein
LASTRWNRPSSTFQTGFPYDPVLSIAPWLTPRSASQSANRSRSSAIVPNVRSSWRAAPPSPGVNAHAATTLLCTSSPQHRAWTTCIVASSPA